MENLKLSFGGEIVFRLKQVKEVYKMLKIGNIAIKTFHHTLP